MKAIEINRKGGPEKLEYVEDAVQPKPSGQEILVKVFATSVTPSELTWSTNWENEDSSPRPFPVIPGHDFSGIVTELGDSVTDVKIGDEVSASAISLE